MTVSPRIGFVSGMAIIIIGFSAMVQVAILAVLVWRLL